MTFLKALPIAALAILSVAAARAETASPPPATPAAPSTPDTSSKSATPDVATLLFTTPQWGAAPVGTEITYAYSKKTTDPKRFGESFNDTARLKLDTGEKPDERVVELRLFTGEHTRPSGPTRSDSQNPALIFALELNLDNLDKAIGIPNPRYLRNAIRKAWRDSAKIEPAEFEVAGKTVKGTRITTLPFAEDPQKDRMLGLDGMAMTIEISDEIPGQIARVDFRAPATGQAIYEESLTYQSESKKP